jgi:DNA (cytosine-5)-methyltransferase 1
MFNYLGYSIDKNILTASNFGVPQKRNRFMMLGVKRNYLNGKNVELSNSSSINHDFSAKDAIEDLEGIEPQKDFKYDPIPYNLDDTNLTPLQIYYRRDIDGKELYNHVNTKSNELSIKRFKEIKNLKGKNFHNLSDELKTTYANSDRTQNTIYLRLNYDEPSPTVVNVRKSMWNHPKNAVAISIREAARLQSFKDNFIFYGSKDQQYQQVGNAVPPLMARGVAEQLLSLIGDAPENPMNEEFEAVTKIESKC